MPNLTPQPVRFAWTLCGICDGGSQGTILRPGEGRRSDPHPRPGQKRRKTSRGRGPVPLRQTTHASWEKGGGPDRSFSLTEADCGLPGRNTFHPIVGESLRRFASSVGRRDASRRQTRHSRLAPPAAAAASMCRSRADATDSTQILANRRTSNGGLDCGLNNFVESAAPMRSAK